jgi:hypothetical protein
MSKRIIITPDDAGYRSESSTALGYDLDTKELIFSLPKNSELISDENKCIGRSPFRPFGISADSSKLYIASNDKIGMYDLLSFEFRLLFRWLLNFHKISNQIQDTQEFFLSFQHRARTKLVLFVYLDCIFLCLLLKRCLV